MQTAAADPGQSGADIRIESMGVFGVPLQHRGECRHLQASDVERIGAADAQRSVVPDVEESQLARVMVAEKVIEAYADRVAVVEMDVGAVGFCRPDMAAANPNGDLIRLAKDRKRN